MAEQWHVFCRVVDNYGDAGVSWRLARQLVAEHGVAVTLWIDRLATLARLDPGVDTTAKAQTLHGVFVRPLADDAITTPLPDVVVEAFGCGLPGSYLDAMAHAPAPPLWINLEYLSAEPWVDTVHGLASPQPQLPLARYFWFPGFTRRTGGLIREGHDGFHVTPVMIFAGLIGAILWNMITWLKGLPSSSSHALFGGLIGAAIAGIGLDAAQWLHQQGMILAGADTMSVEAVPPLDHAVHRYLLVHHGVTHLENLYLEDLAAHHVYEFLLIVTPLRLQGSTGSWVHPIAIA